MASGAGTVGVRQRGAATLLVLAACGGGGTGEEGPHSPQGTASPEGTGQLLHSAPSRKGTYRVSWRPLGGQIPFNEPFDLEVRLAAPSDDGAVPVTGAQVYVRCDMPEHGHGMNVEPRALDLGGGSYRVEGLLLHMRGRWVLGIDVVVDGTAETADFELVVE